MIIGIQSGLTYINSKHIIEFRADRLHDEEKKYAIIAKLDYKEGEHILAAYADEEQFKQEYSRFLTAMINDEDKMLFFADEKKPEPEKEAEAETEEEVNIEVNIEVNRDEIIESLREILRAARIQRLLNRAKDIRYIDEWIVKEENGSREGF